MTMTIELRNPVDGFAASAPDRLTHRELPIVFERREPAANDADAARAALDSIVRSKPVAWHLHQATRAHRSHAMGEIFAATARAVAAMLRDAYAGYVRRREAKAVRLALGELDDRTLRDLGLDRSEIGSVAAEVAGGAERTRILSALTRNAAD
jgi:uncharacterized protein YjiS (DUF1127 family)